MKTALILGASAVGFYLFYRFAQNVAAAQLGSPIGGPAVGVQTTQVQYPSVPAGTTPATTIAQTAQLGFVSGTIASTTPVATGLTPTGAQGWRRAGYVIIGSNAYQAAAPAAAPSNPSPPPSPSAHTVVSGGGLVPVFAPGAAFHAAAKLGALS
jgi:hypothetical protein